MMDGLQDSEQAAWADLETELERWRTEGRRATLWWRDDDAVEPTPALERLLGLAAAHRLPLCLAVIPLRAGRPLAERLAQAPEATVLQHGISHANLAGPEAKKQELAASLPAARILDGLARGAARLEGLCAPGAVRRLPVLVPPWNRIDAGLLEGLPGLGFKGLSAMGPRPAAEAAPGLLRVNCHVDILRWKPTRGFLGTAEVLAGLTARLAARRTGAEDPDEATGLLTHHLAQDEAAWAFLARLLDRLAAHPAVRFPTPSDVFGAAP